jgi:eukaryotic-like serine/threonine-protein kinase
MASVYRVRDHWFNRDLALKLLLPHNSRSGKTRKRFLNEARTMSQLDHPNIIQVHDIGEEDGHFFFVMEIASVSLSTHVRRHGRMDPEDAIQHMFQALNGLEYAHTAGVVHRDIKPHNMLLGVNNDQVKLTDFGIARVLAMSTDARVTGTGDTLGTLAYMSPEQRVDPRRAGPPADVYGIGATLYILVTGRRPFDLAMSAIDPSVMERLPIPLRPIVRRSTAHRPDDRYQTAKAMAVALLEARHELVPSAAPLIEDMDEFGQATDAETILQVTAREPESG